MFYSNSALVLDFVSTLASSFITHLDPFSRLINPKRWEENQAIHYLTYKTLVAQNPHIPVSITYLNSRRNYPLAFQDACQYVTDLFISLDTEKQANLITIANYITENCTQIFCQRSFNNDAIAASSKQKYTFKEDIAILIPFRATNTSDGRLNNLLLSLDVLTRQSYAHKVLLLVIESDVYDRNRIAISRFDTAYLFHQNSRNFNKSAAINAGVSSLATQPKFLCILDSDAYIDEYFLELCLCAISACEAKTFMPFTDMMFLDIESTRLVRNARIESIKTLTGYVTRRSPGGCIWVTTNIFNQVMGFNENFSGWGGEDRDFYRRVASYSAITRLPGMFVHMHHERAPEIYEWAKSEKCWKNSMEKKTLNSTD
jgi:hypothetical protein